jgi:RNA polymerase sigma-70 factor (ECF subfamily)
MATGSVFETQHMLAHAKGGDPAALGQLLERYRQYLTLLAHVQIGRAIRVKIGGSDVVQEAFLEAHRDFGGFRGETVGELVAWLRQILARNLANQVRRYRGTRARDVRLERGLADALAGRRTGWRRPRRCGRPPRARTPPGWRRP